MAISNPSHVSDRCSVARKKKCVLQSSCLLVFPFAIKERSITVVLVVSSVCSLFPSSLRLSSSSPPQFHFCDHHLIPMTRLTLGRLSTASYCKRQFHGDGQAVTEACVLTDDEFLQRARQQEVWITLVSELVKAPGTQSRDGNQE